MSRINVLMFGWELPPNNSGGLGTACEGLLHGFEDRDVAVTFVLPRRIGSAVSARGAVVAYAEDCGQTVFRPIDSPLYAYASEEEFGTGGGGLGTGEGGLLGEVRRYAEAAARIADETVFDIIHAHDWLSFGAGLVAKARTGKPLIVHVHATEFDRGGGAINQRIYEIERDGMERADRIIAVSNYTKNIIVRHYGIAPEKITVIHNGVKPEFYPELEEVEPDAALAGKHGRRTKKTVSSKLDLKKLKKNGAKIVLFLGRITLQKGPDYFLKAARQVLEHEPNTYFILVGSGDMERQMVRQAARAGISDRVIFAGFLRGAERTALYRAADLYIMPSVSEPFGIAPLEAMLEGTPVLISKQSGVSEAVRDALKVDFWDTDEMTNKIVSVLRNKPLHTTLKNRGKKEAQMSTWKRAADKVFELYRSLIEYVRDVSI